MTATDKDTAVAGTQSVLDMMTAGVMARKATPPPTLTPVGAERKQNDNDMFAAAPRHELWALTESLKDLIRTATALVAVLPASNAGAAPDPAAAPEDVEKQKEFDADMAAKARAAQEATFAKPAPAPASEATSTWKCPKHGEGVIKESKRGRKYGACPTDGCEEIEL